MPKVLQRNLRRGRVADRIGLLLLAALLAALLGAILTGFSSLQLA